MNGRRAIVGLCMLCALLLSAFAAQSASATEVKGTTAFTCVEAGGKKDWNTSHCRDAVSRGTGSFGHVEIGQDTTTNLQGNSNGEPTRLKATVSTIPIELVSQKLKGNAEAWMENKLDPNGDHFAFGEGKIIYEEVTEPKNGCTVTGLPGGAGTVETKQLKATTTGTGMGLKFEPAAGVATAFAEFELGGGACPAALKAKYKVVGSVIGEPEGATTRFKHGKESPAEGTTGQKTLRIGSAAGPVAGIEGVLTLEGKDPKIGGDSFKPLTTTTIET